MSQEHKNLASNDGPLASRGRRQFWRHLYGTYLKRFLDVLLACLALAVSMPFLLLLGLLLMFETPGSPIFRQARIGTAGNIFQIYKLRTMVAGTESLGFKTANNDQRITRLGNLLRKSKIDELPQLWNVICGQMSLIGPRPLSVDEGNYLQNVLGHDPQEPGFYPQVRPGLTGIEQIYRIHPLVYSERFYWNKYYESNLSASLDLRILLNTIALHSFVCVLVLVAALAELLWLLSEICGH